MIVVLLEVADNTRVPTALSTSVMVSVNAPVVPPSAMTWSASVAMVGASFTAVTVTSKLVVTGGLTPSLTDTVMATGPPFWFAAGTMVIVLLGPDVPKEMLLALLGIIPTSSEVAERTKSIIASSGSVIVKTSTPVVPSSLIT